MPNQCCGNCKYGKFQMTRHDPPRPRPKHFGYCDFPMLPNTNEFLSKIPSAADHKEILEVANRTCHTWPDMGAGCPVWERRA